MDTEIGAETDLFGKYVSDLQSDVIIDNDDNEIVGTLKYVDDYTGFSSDVAMQSGNYIAIHASVDNVDDATITVTITNPSVLDEDGIFVGRIRDKDSQTITVVASKDGYETVTKTFDISGLTTNDS